MRFELKPIHFRGENHEDNIDFEKTKKWLDTEYFEEKIRTEDKKQRNENIRINLKELFLDFDLEKNSFEYLLKQLQQNNIPSFCVFVKASLLENLDSQLFHEQKKNFNKTKLEPLGTMEEEGYYEVEAYIPELTSSELGGKELTDEACYRIYYKGGSTEHCISQKENAGKWVKIASGERSYEKGSKAGVRLIDEVYNPENAGKIIVADAIRWSNVGTKMKRGAPYDLPGAKVKAITEKYEEYNIGSGNNQLGLPYIETDTRFSDKTSFVAHWDGCYFQFFKQDISELSYFGNSGKSVLTVCYFDDYKKANLIKYEIWEKYKEVKGAIHLREIFGDSYYPEGQAVLQQDFKKGSIIYDPITETTKICREKINWPMYQGNAQHTGEQPMMEDITSQPYNKIISFVGEYSKAQMVVFDDYIYHPTNNGKLYKINKNTGEKTLFYDTGNNYYELLTPVISGKNRLIYVPDTNGYMHVIYLDSSGNSAGGYQGRSSYGKYGTVTAPIETSNGYIYYTSSTELYRIKKYPYSAEVIKTVGTEPKPEIAKFEVEIQTKEGWKNVDDITTQENLSNTKTTVRSSSIYNSVTASPEGVIYIATRSLEKIDINGFHEWTVPGAFYNKTIPLTEGLDRLATGYATVLKDNILLVRTEDKVDFTNVYPNSKDTGHLYAFDVNTKRVKWVTEIGNGKSSPVIKNNEVYIVGGKYIDGVGIDGYLYALDLETGTEKWKYSISDYGSVGVGNETLYVSTFNKAQVIGIDINTHQKLWQTSFKHFGPYNNPYGFLYQPVSLTEDKILVTVYDWPLNEGNDIPKNVVSNSNNITKTNTRSIIKENNESAKDQIQTYYTMSEQTLDHIKKERETELNTVSNSKTISKSYNYYGLKTAIVSLQNACGELPAPKFTVYPTTKVRDSNYLLEWDSTGIHELEESLTPTFEETKVITTHVPKEYFGNQEDGTYYYRISTRNECTTSEYSNVLQVNVSRNKKPTTNIIVPANNTLVYTYSPIFQWSTSDEDSEDQQESFEVLLSKDSAFKGESTKTFFDNTIKHYLYSPEKLENKQIYYWKVRTKDTYGDWSDWSFVNRFMIKMYDNELYISSNEHNYGETEIATTTEKEFIVHNYGSGYPVGIKEVKLKDYTAEEYRIKEENCSSRALSYLESCKIIVEYSPKGLTENIATLEIYEKYTVLPVLNIALKGNGIPNQKHEELDEMFASVEDKLDKIRNLYIKGREEKNKSLLIEIQDGFIDILKWCKFT